MGFIVHSASMYTPICACARVRSVCVCVCVKISTYTCSLYTRVEYYIILYFFSQSQPSLPVAATILHPGSVARERVKRVRQLSQRQPAEGWRVSPVQHGCQSGRGTGGLSRGQPHPAQQRAGCRTLQRTGEDRPPTAAPARNGGCPDGRGFALGSHGEEGAHEVVALLVPAAAEFGAEHQEAVASSAEKLWVPTVLAGSCQLQGGPVMGGRAGERSPCAGEGRDDSHVAA